jgi:hypothetical protein
VIAICPTGSQSIMQGNPQEEGDVQMTIAGYFSALGLAFEGPLTDR